MATVRIPSIETDSFVPAGGLNEVSAPLRLKAGAAREMENFYCAVDGGYQRTKGIERWAAGLPAEAFAFSKLTVTAPPSGARAFYIGGLLRGVTSGVSARVLWMKGDTLPFNPALSELGVPILNKDVTAGATVDLYVFNIGGLPQAGETLNSYGIDDTTLVGTFTAGAFADLDATTPTTYATERLECDKFWRFLQGYKPPYAIGAVSYTSYTQPNLALEEVNGQVWLFRPAKWLPDGTNRMLFNWCTNNGGERFFAGYWQAQAIQSDECFGEIAEYVDTVTFNFGSGVKKIYGVTGKGKAWELNPQNFAVTPITTGMAVDKPTRVAVHKNRLFLAFGASIQWSAAADPFTWSAVVGAGEINVGDEVTKMQSVIGSDSSSSLVIATRKKLFILYGDSVANFTLVNVSPEIGVHPATFQQFGVPLFMSDFGVTTLSAAQSFGNFAAATITGQIQDFINEHRDQALCSVLVRSLNQYRVFFRDRTAIYITLSGVGKPLGMTIMRFPFTIRRAISFINPLTGKEICLCITEEHDRVFQMDTGRRFDDHPIDWYAVLAYNHSKSPRVLKSYRKAVLEIIADIGYIELQVGADVDYGGPYRKSTPDQTISDPNVNSSANWDALTWDQFTYDGSPLVPVEVPIDGTGENVSLRIRGRSEIIDQFTWTGGIVHFIKRRFKR